MGSTGVLIFKLCLFCSKGAGGTTCCCFAWLLQGGEGLASFAGLDRVDPDELDEDDDKLETPEDCEAAF